MIKIIDWKSLSSLERINSLRRPVMKNKYALSEKVKLIIQRVREKGDLACINMTSEFDNVDIKELLVSESEIAEASKQVSKSTLQAINKIINQLTTFHVPQKINNYKVESIPGVLCESVSMPLQRVGIYVPGGSAPLVSTVLMLGVPSQIAGCPTRILCTPPTKDGSINANILVAARLCGINKIVKLGGAQAIAAMAYGTETIPKVDKIVGPGNSWVTEAKMQVSQDYEGAQYDSPAGPSEILIIADNSANAEYIAADLLSQAEHGIDSQVILACTNREIANNVNNAIQRQLSGVARCDIALQVLQNSKIIIVGSVNQAIEIANEYAPEHLVLQVNQPRDYVANILCAGSVFIGPWSAVSAGDYATGTTHVLPTYGYAKCMSGLTVRDFMKTMSIQELSRTGLETIAESIRILADIEGLFAHKNAIDIRLGVNANAE